MDFRPKIYHNGLPGVQMEVNMESKWVPKVPSETPWTPLGRFGDHVGSFGELLGRSGVSLGALKGDFGIILGAFWEHACLQDQICSLFSSLLSLFSSFFFFCPHFLSFSTLPKCFPLEPARAGAILDVSAFCARSYPKCLPKLL